MTQEERGDLRGISTRKSMVSPEEEKNCANSHRIKHPDQTFSLEMQGTGSQGGEVVPLIQETPEMNESNTRKRQEQRQRRLLLKKKIHRKEGMVHEKRESMKAIKYASCCVTRVYSLDLLTSFTMCYIVYLSQTTK